MRFGSRAPTNWSVGGGRRRPCLATAILCSRPARASSSRAWTMTCCTLVSMEWRRLGACHAHQTRARSCMVRVALAINVSSGSRYMSYRTRAALIQETASFRHSSADLISDRFTIAARAMLAHHEARRRECQRGAHCSTIMSVSRKAAVAQYACTWQTQHTQDCHERLVRDILLRCVATLNAQEAVRAFDHPLGRNPRLREVVILSTGSCVWIRNTQT